MDRSPSSEFRESRATQPETWRPLSEWRKTNIFNLRRRSSENQGISYSEANKGDTGSLSRHERSRKGTTFDVMAQCPHSMTSNRQTMQDLASNRQTMQDLDSIRQTMQASNRQTMQPSNKQTMQELASNRQTMQASRRQTMQAPKRQTMQDLASNRQTMQDPTSRRQTMQDPASNRQTMQDPDSNGQSMQELASNRQTMQDPDSNRQTMQEFASNRQTMQASRRQTVQDPVSNRQTMQDPVSNTQTMQDPASNRQTMQEFASNRQTIQASRRQTVHDPVSNRQTMQDPASNRQTMQGVASNRQTMQASRRQTMQDPVSNRQTMQDPASNRQTMQDPVSNRQTMQEFASNRKTMQASRRQTMQDPVSNRQTMQDPASNRQTMQEFASNRQTMQASRRQTMQDPESNRQTMQDFEGSDEVYQLTKELLGESEQYEIQADESKEESPYSLRQTQVFESESSQQQEQTALQPYNQQQRRTESFGNGFDPNVEQDLFLQCQNHLDVIGAYSELQQTIKSEMNKQARLDNTIYHKMTAKAERLNQTALKLQEMPTLEWTVHALGDLGAHVTQQAQAHRVYMSLLNHQCLVIQRSLDSHFELMKKMSQSSSESASPLSQEQMIEYQESEGEDYGTQEMTFSQANNAFEEVRKPRMILVNKMDDLEAQQLETMEELSQLEETIQDLSTNQQCDMLQWQLQHKLKDSQSRKEFLILRKEQIQSDLKNVVMELNDFDFDNRDKLLEVLNVFRQHRVSFDTTLRKSFQLLKAVSLRETDMLRDLVKKNRSWKNQEQQMTPRVLRLPLNRHRNSEFSMEGNQQNYDSQTPREQNRRRTSVFASQLSKALSSPTKSTNPFRVGTDEKKMSGRDSSFFLKNSPDFSPSDESTTGGKNVPFQNEAEDEKLTGSLDGYTDFNFSRVETSSGETRSKNEKSHCIFRLPSNSDDDSSEENEKQNSEGSQLTSRDTNRIAAEIDHYEANLENAIIAKYMEDTDRKFDNFPLFSSKTGQRISLANYGYKARDVKDLLKLAKIEDEMKAFRNEDKAIELINKYVCHGNKHASLSKNFNNCEAMPTHVQQATENLGNEDCLEFEAAQTLPKESKVLKKLSESARPVSQVQGRDLKICTVKPIHSQKEAEDKNTNSKASGSLTRQETKKNSYRKLSPGQNRQCQSNIGRSCTVVELQLYEVTAGQFLAQKEEGVDSMKIPETKKMEAVDSSNNLQSATKEESNPDISMNMENCETQFETENVDESVPKESVSFSENNPVRCPSTQEQQVNVQTDYPSLEADKDEVADRLSDQTFPKTVYTKEPDVLSEQHIHNNTDTFSKENQIDRNEDSQGDAGVSKTRGTAGGNFDPQLNVHQTSMSHKVDTDQSDLTQTWEERNLMKSNRELGVCQSVESLEEVKASVQKESENEETLDIDTICRFPLSCVRYARVNQTLSANDLHAYPQQSAPVKQGKAEKRVRFDDRVHFDDNTERVYTHHMHSVSDQTLDTSARFMEDGRSLDTRDCNMRFVFKEEFKYERNINYSNNTKTSPMTDEQRQNVGNAPIACKIRTTGKSKINPTASSTSLIQHTPIGNPLTCQDQDPKNSPTC